MNVICMQTQHSGTWLKRIKNSRLAWAISWNTFSKHKWSKTNIWTISNMILCLPLKEVRKGTPLDILKSSNFSSSPHGFQCEVACLLEMRGQPRRVRSLGVPSVTASAPLHVCMPQVHVRICDSVYKCVTFPVTPMPRERQGRGRIKVKDNCHWLIYLMAWKHPIRAVCTHSWLLSYRTAWCSAWIKVPCGWHS